MRVEFSPKTIKTLAERAAYRCCFPSCKRLTVGPKSLADDRATVLGEAAHIYAASVGGPRSVPGMTTAQLRDISNGIWMCRAHARLIDVDHYAYSAETLKEWKQVAEAGIYRKLMELQRDEVPEPTTLICLDLNLMFEGIWKSAEDDIWTFTVKHFIFGNEQILREYGQNRVPPMLNYIIIESQGDGRLIKSAFKWSFNADQEYEVQVQVLPRAEREYPDEIGEDIAYDPEGDIMVAGPAGKKIAGKDKAIQILERNLSLPLGGWANNVLLGSFFSMYYQQYQSKPELLNRLIKIELGRLISIPAYQMHTKAAKPELNFVNRIIDVQVRKESNGRVPIFLSLEWADHSFWTGDICVQLYQEGQGSYHPPEYVQELFKEKPLTKLRKLTATLGHEEVRDKVSLPFIYKFFNETLPAILTEANHILFDEIYPLFLSHEANRFYNGYTNIGFDTEATPGTLERTGTVSQIGMSIKLEGFKRAGTAAFSTYDQFFCFFNEFQYEIGDSRQSIWLKRLYHVPLSAHDIRQIADLWTDRIISGINERINWANQQQL